jgi:hypothetical protein
MLGIMLAQVAVWMSGSWKPSLDADSSFATTLSPGHCRGGAHQRLKTRLAAGSYSHGLAVWVLVRATVGRHVEKGFMVGRSGSMVVTRACRATSYQRSDTW